MKPYKTIFKELSLLMLPFVFSNLISAASSIISMYFLSQLNSDALAAGAIITSTYGLIMMMTISLLYSISIMVGQMQGAKQFGEIGKIFFSGIFITLAYGIPFTLLMCYMTPVFDVFGQPHHISILAGSYFNGLAVGLIPSFISAAFVQLFMSTSRAKAILHFTMVDVIIQSTLSYLFIFGIGHFHGLGVFGAGLARAISSYILVFMMIGYVWLSPKFHHYHLFNQTSFTLKYLPILFKIGLPISIQYSIELVAFTTLTYLMGTLGVAALSAQQIALQCNMVTLMVVMGISQSGSILVSRAVGEKNISDLNKIANCSLLIGTTFLFIVGLLYWLAPTSLIALYMNPSQPDYDSTITVATAILSIAAFTQIFDGGRNIAAGLLRGYGDTKSSMWSGLISCWFIGLPLSILLGFAFHLNAIGLRLGMMLGILFGCIRLVLHFYKHNKKCLTYATYAR